MAADLATLGIKVDSSDLDKSQKRLTSFVKRGVSAEDRLKTLEKTAGRSFQKIGRGSRDIQGTTFAVTNFNRVVQDAPFGLMGVANNIDPMIQSFNSLRAQTGSTTGALKTLITSAFTGPGALITVTSLASTALLVFGDELFSTEKKAEELTSTMEQLNKSWEQTIRLQGKFGAFDEDTFGTAKLQSQIREITEDIEEQQAIISRIRNLEEERREIRAGYEFGSLTRAEAERLQTVERELARYADIEQVNLRLEKLTERRQQLSLDLVNLGDALADSDTEQARQAQLLAEEKERQEKFERQIAEARREARQFERPEDVTFEVGTDTSGVGLDLGSRLFPEGSLGVLRERLRELQRELEMATNPRTIRTLQDEIQSTQQQMRNLGGDTRSTSAELDALAAAAEQMGISFNSAFTEAIIRGEQFSNVLQSILQDILRIMIQTQITNPFARAISSMFGGGRAAGGPVSSDKVYLVGEEGPELFAPGRSGAIIPNQQMQQRSSPVNIQIINNTGEQVETTERRNGQGGLDIEVMIGKVVKDMFNNGNMDSTMQRNYRLARRGRHV